MAKVDNRKQIKLSVSPEEYKLFEKKAVAQNLPLATFIRNFLLQNLDKETTVKADSKPDDQNEGMVYLSDLIADQKINTKTNSITSNNNSESCPDCEECEYCNPGSNTKQQKTNLNGVNLTINIQR